MKKLLTAMIIGIIPAVFLAACSGKAEPANAASVTDAREAYNNVFEQIGYGNGYIIVYHKQTKVMYVVSDGMYNRCSFTVMVNPDGTPMTYKAD